LSAAINKPNNDRTADYSASGTSPHRIGTNSRFASRSITTSNVVVEQIFYRAGKFRSGVAGRVKR
jgi:hypothetical protein